VLIRFDPLLDGLSAARPQFAPQRYGLVTACDGGLLEVSGLPVPVGALCRVAQGSTPLAADRSQRDLAHAERRRAAVEARLLAQARLLTRQRQTPALGARRAAGTGLEE
jgi:hypothetical protein